jgi:hypothetical protein
MFFSGRQLVVFGSIRNTTTFLWHWPPTCTVIANNNIRSINYCKVTFICWEQAGLTQIHRSCYSDVLSNKVWKEARLEMLSWCETMMMVCLNVLLSSVNRGLSSVEYDFATHTIISPPSQSVEPSNLLERRKHSKTCSSNNYYLAL